MSQAARQRWIAIVGQGRGGTSTLYYAAIDALHDAGHRTLRTYEKYHPKMFESFGQHHRERWVVAKFLTNHPTFSEDLLRRFGRRIQVVRDPRDNLVSVMLFSAAHLARRDDGGQHVGKLVALLERKERDPAAVSLTSLLEVALVDGLERDMAEFLERRYTYPMVLQERTGMTVVRLEDLIAGRTDAAEDVIGAPVALQPPPRAKAHVLRSGRPSWARWFLPEDVAALRPALQPFMNRFGYGDDWSLDPDPQVDPAESSQYVRRTFDAIAARVAHAAEDPPLELLRYRGGDGCHDSAYRAALRLLEVGEHLPEARELALFAASAGHRRAMELSGQLFADGVGGPVNRAEARYWRAQARPRRPLRRRVEARLGRYGLLSADEPEEQALQGAAISS